MRGPLRERRAPVRARRGLARGGRGRGQLRRGRGAGRARPPLPRRPRPGHGRRPRPLGRDHARPRPPRARRDRLRAATPTRADGGRLAARVRTRAPKGLPAPRMLGQFEPILLGWESRTEIIGAAAEAGSIVTSNGIFRPFALVEGQGRRDLAAAEGRPASSSRSRGSRRPTGRRSKPTPPTSAAFSALRPEATASRAPGLSGACSARHPVHPMATAQSRPCLGSSSSPALPASARGR